MAGAEVPLAVVPTLPGGVLAAELAAARRVAMEGRFGAGDFKLGRGGGVFEAAGVFGIDGSGGNLGGAFLPEVEEDEPLAEVGGAGVLSPNFLPSAAARRLAIKLAAAFAGT